MWALGPKKQKQKTKNLCFVLFLVVIFFPYFPEEKQRTKYPSRISTKMVQRSSNPSQHPNLIQINV